MCVCVCEGGSDDVNHVSCVMVDLMRMGLLDLSLVSIDLVHVFIHRSGTRVWIFLMMMKMRGDSGFFCLKMERFFSFVMNMCNLGKKD